MKVLPPSWTIGSASRRFGTAFLLFLCFGVTGCSWLLPAPQRFSATGWAKVDAAAAEAKQSQEPANVEPERPGQAEGLPPVPAEDYPIWAGEQLEIQGVALLPERMRHQTTALMMARRQAQDDALKQMADNVAALPAPGSMSVLEFLKINPNAALNLEGVIRSTAQFDKGALYEGNIYEINGTLPLGPTAILLFGPPPQGVFDEPEVAEPEVASTTEAEPDGEWDPGHEPGDSEAFRLALADARMRLMEAVKLMLVAEGRTLGDWMAVDDRAAASVGALVENARVEKVEYPAPGECEIQLFLLRSDLEGALD